MSKSVSQVGDMFVKFCIYIILEKWAKCSLTS